MFINLNMAYLFLFLFFLSNIQLAYHQQTPGLRKYLMQCLISQKQRINEVQMFCQIIFPRELVKEPSHPIKLFLCQLLPHKCEVLLQSADVLKMATNSKIIKYPIPHSQLKNPQKTCSVSLHIVHHYDRDETLRVEALCQCQAYSGGFPQH